jgi:hypothetical protein
MALSRPASPGEPVVLKLALSFAILALCAMYVPPALAALTALTGACWLAVLIFDPRHTMRERILGGLVPLAPAFAEAAVGVVGPMRAAVATLAVGAAIAVLARRRGDRARAVWETALAPVGWTALTACLTVFFFVVLTPIAAAWRRVRGRPILEGIDRERATYWEPRAQSSAREHASRLY